MCVCLSVQNRLPNHAHYGDEPFTGESIGQEEGRRLIWLSTPLAESDDLIEAVILTVNG